MKNKFFYNKFLPVLCIFLIVLFVFNTYSFGFTEEEQSEINRIVSTLKANSKNQSVTWAIDDNNTKKAYFSADFDYNGNTCSYIAIMYWRSQCSVTFTNGVVVGKNIDSAQHDLNVYYYDSDLNCLGAKPYHLNGGSSISISGVNYYFYSEYTMRNNSGEVVDPFFPSPPQEITGVLVAETTKAQIMEQIKTMIVGFLKYLIVLVISVIAFYKGWKFLLTQLRKS